MPIVITPRDEHVLRLLGMFRVMTLKQIREHCFTQLSVPLVQRRLAKLRMAKLVRAFPFGVSGTNAWTLTSEGARASGFTESAYTRPPNTNTVHHDLVVTDYGLRMNVFGRINGWLAAHELMSKSNFKDTKSRIPDAVFEMDGIFKDSKLAALEVENTTKDDRRLTDFVHDYFLLNAEISDVFILWRSMSLRMRLRHRIEEYKYKKWRTPPRFWFSNSSLNNGLCFDFTSLNGETFNLLRGPVVAPVSVPVSAGAGHSNNLGAQS